MKKLPKFITDERTGLKYELCGDYYIIAGEDEPEREDTTEQLKETNQMDWVGNMNNIRQRATEIVNSEIIYI